VLIQPRVHIYTNGKVNLAAAKKVLNEIMPVGLAEFTGKPKLPTPRYDYPAPVFADPTLPVSALNFTDPLQFWDLFSLAMNENPPPPDQVSALLPMFAPLAIVLGTRWDRSKRAPLVIDTMARAARDIAPILNKLTSRSPVPGAFFPPPSMGNFGTDYSTRAAVARVGLTGNTPYEAIYWSYLFDSEGHPLHGEKAYEMRFKEEIPHIKPGFWSITLYDSANNYTVANPINRYMLGSDTLLKKNPDGSFTIYIQNENPGPDKEPNWLPSLRGRQFYLTPRAFAPTQAAINILSDPLSWPVPLVVLVK
jgi:DNA sulfur modification protein DndE